MKELIKISEQNGRNAVSARELHLFLEVKEKFTEWIKRMFEYGFTQNADYQSLSDFSEKPNGGRPSIDYALSIDCAKEISMLQRSDKGKEARQYFLECEKKLKNLQPFRRNVWNCNPKNFVNKLRKWNILTRFCNPKAPTTLIRLQKNWE